MLEVLRAATSYICAMLLEDGDNQSLMPSPEEIATMEEWTIFLTRVFMLFTCYIHVP